MKIFFAESLLILSGLIEVVANKSFHSVTTNYSIMHHHQTLHHDEAVFRLQNLFENTLVLKGVTTNCYECDLQYLDESSEDIEYVVDTNFPFQYAIYLKSPNTLLCSGTYQFGEKGIYQMSIATPSVIEPMCTDIVIVKEPIFAYSPILVMFGVLLLFTILYCTVSYIKKKYFSGRPLSRYLPIGEFDNSYESSSLYGSLGNNRKMIAPAPDNGNEDEHRRSRLRSLDTFRGISIIIMIFVNYGGGKYWFFNHSKWNGLTVADLVFPWFIFIMGTSIFISCRSLRRKRVSKRSISFKILIRSIKLFALGLFINNGFDLGNWRIPGVLQRFALSYFVVAMVNLWLSPDEDVVDTHFNYDWRDTVRDLSWFPFHHLIMLLLLASYLLIIFLARDPNCPRGYFGAGGLSELGQYFNCTGGIAGFIDRKVFGKHMYQSPTCSHVYKCISHDPEGLLGVIPSILLTYFGLQAGKILFMYSHQSSHLKRWFLWSVLMGVIALGLCGGTQNNGAIPVNKNLWSLSFILATGGLAYLLLLICYYVIDVKHWWNGAPFYFGGMNAILLYAGHELLSYYFPFNFKNNGQHSELLTRSFVGTTMWTIIAYVCFKKKFFVKI